MKIWKQFLLFYLGGMLYCGLELMWRGRSHGSMFLLGGACFLVLGKVGALKLNLVSRAVLGGALITVGELAMGLLVNRGFQVWDYRSLPMNFCGQICLLYTLFWMMLSPVGFVVYRHAERKLPG